MFTPQERERVRSALLVRAEQDPAVVSAAVTGSQAIGEGDRWSDIDLGLGIEGPVELVMDSWTRWLYQEFEAQHHWDLPSGSSTYRVFLLPGWLEIDLAFTPADDFRARGPRWGLLFGDEQPAAPFPTPAASHVVGRAWHHVLHARICIERGRWWQAEHWIGAARGCLLQLACLRHGHPGDYAKGAHLLPDDEILGLEATLVTALTSEELARALNATLVALGAELDRSDAALAQRLGPMLADLGLHPIPEKERSAEMRAVPEPETDVTTTTNGPGAFTDDGCPVEVYRLLPSRGEPEFIHDHVPQGCRILDLGAGTGRIADPLVAMGHQVLAVDNSAAMLANVQHAETTLSDIVAFRDTRTFAAVILASTLINNPDPGVRHGLLKTVAHHLDPDGIALIQWHNPDWFDRLQRGVTHRGTIGPMASELHVASFNDGLLDATVTYEHATGTWSQTFQARRLTLAQVDAELAATGLRLVEASPAGRDWLIAAPAQTPDPA